MKNIRIHIPDMQSEHCQMRVRKALGNAGDIEVKNITSGIAEITVTAENGLRNASQAIEQAGYTISGVETQQDQGNGKLTFKTNINCSGCVAKVTPFLDAVAGVSNWSVDTTAKDKLLTVETNGAVTEDIVRAVKESGFSIETRN